MLCYCFCLILLLFAPAESPLLFLAHMEHPMCFFFLFMLDEHKFLFYLFINFSCFKDFSSFSTSISTLLSSTPNSSISLPISTSTSYNLCGSFFKISLSFVLFNFFLIVFVLFYFSFAAEESPLLLAHMQHHFIFLKISGRIYQFELHRL